MGELGEGSHREGHLTQSHKPAMSKVLTGVLAKPRLHFVLRSVGEEESHIAMETLGGGGGGGYYALVA